MAKSISAIFLILMLVSTTITFATPSYVYADHLIPKWVKDNMKWYAEGAISEQDMINAIKFLLEKKIISLEEKETQKTDDGDWLSGIHNSLTSAVKQIQSNPTADLMVKSILPVIPVAGPLLANLYENASGSTSEKNAQILKVLEEYQKMDEAQLQKAFSKLEENKELILTNQYKLDEVLVDTKLLKQGQEDILKELKEQRELLHTILAQNGITSKLDPSKIGTISQDAQNQMKEKENEIKQLKSQIEELTGEKLKTDVESLEELANSKLYAADNDGAIEVYKQILETDEKNFDALNGMGWAHIYKEEPKEAIKWFNQVLEHHPNHPEDADTFEGLGWAYLDDGSPSDAIPWFDKAIEEDPEWVYGYIGKGQALIELGNYDEAVTTCQAALDIEPSNEDAILCIEDAQ